MTIIIAPASLLTNFKGRKTQKVVDGLPVNLTELGQPNMEAEGVPNRRMAFGHPFTPDEVAQLQAYIDTLSANLRNNIYFTSDLPADWRWA